MVIQTNVTLIRQFMLRMATEVVVFVITVNIILLAVNASYASHYIIVTLTKAFLMKMFANVSHAYFVFCLRKTSVVFVIYLGLFAKPNSKFSFSHTFTFVPLSICQHHKWSFKLELPINRPSDVLTQSSTI